MERIIKIRSSEFGIRSSEFGIRSSEFGIRSSEFRIQTDEFIKKLNGREVSIAKFQKRAVDLEEVEEDSEGILEFSISSDLPCERYWFTEILEHTESAVNLNRFRDSANVLFNHKASDYLGVIENGWLDGNKLRIRACFELGNEYNKLARQVYTSILNKTLRNVSIGYDYDEIQWEEKQGKEILRATRWTPLEASIVTVPADATVGIGRSYYDLSPNIRSNIEPKMDQSNNQTIEVNENDIIQKERQRIATITALGQKFNCKDITEKAINEGKSLDETRAIVLERVVGQQQPVAKTTDPLGLSHKEERSYSVCRAIMAALNGNWDNAGLEKEVHDALIAKDRSNGAIKSRNGVRIPFFDLMVSQRAANDGYIQLMKSAAIRNSLERSYTRDFEVGTPAQGGNLVETQLDETRFIEIFRNAAMVLQMGATTLTGLVGNLDLPKQLTGSTDGTNTYWVAEGVDVGQIDATFGLLQIRPKTLGAFMIATRLMMLQSSIDIEQFMRRELAINVALGVDKAAISGTGINDQPLGLINTPGVNSIAFGTNGGSPTWARMVQFETKVAVANADVGSMGWLGNARTRGELKSVEKFGSTTGQTIWMDSQMPGEGMVNGYRFGVSNQIPSTLTKGTGTNLSALAFGKWSELFFAEWGNTEILANPYSDEYLSGGIRIRILHTCDIGVRHAQCFSVATDLATPLSLA